MSISSFIVTHDKLASLMAEKTSISDKSPKKRRKEEKNFETDNEGNNGLQQ